MSTANIVTLSRLPLLFGLVGLLFVPGGPAKLVALLLLAVLFLMDWFDGYVARLKNEVTDLGSVMDIAIDRVVENILWITFMQLGLVRLWVPVVFLTRSFVVDSLRGFALTRGKSAFGMMTSGPGKFLVASRFMRGLYGFAKLAAFASLAAMLAAAEYSWAWRAELAGLSQVLVVAAVALCIARGLPVVFDSHYLFSSSGRAA